MLGRRQPPVQLQTPPFLHLRLETRCAFIGMQLGGGGQGLYKLILVTSCTTENLSESPYVRVCEAMKNMDPRKKVHFFQVAPFYYFPLIIVGITLTTVSSPDPSTKYSAMGNKHAKYYATSTRVGVTT